METTTYKIFRRSIEILILSFNDSNFIFMFADFLNIKLIVYEVIKNRQIITSSSYLLYLMQKTFFQKPIILHLI